jgi:predicted metal-dependent enzyme (double-stranded beta helix superfamily)
MATLEEARRDTYTFDEFLADLERITDDLDDPLEITGAVAPLLERLIQDPECIDEQFRRHPPGGRGRYMLHRAPRFNVTSVLWRPGDRLAAHTHETWGVIGILENEIQETRFLADMGPLGSRAELPVKAVNRQVQGTVSRLVPGDEVHEMHNVTDRDTIEIHVYGKDLVGLERRRLGDDGAVERLVSPKYLNC